MGLHRSTTTVTRCGTSSPSTPSASGTAPLPGVAPGTRYGYRADGPWDPEAGLRFNAAKLLLDPYGKAVSGDLVVDDAIFGYTMGDPATISDLDSAPYVPAQRGRLRRLPVGRRHLAAPPVARHRHLRDARQGHDQAARPGARRSCAGRTPASPRRRSPTTSATSASRPWSCCRCTSSSPSPRWPRTAWSTTGATTRSASSPRTTPTARRATAASRSPSSSRW